MANVLSFGVLLFQSCYEALRGPAEDGELVESGSAHSYSMQVITIALEHIAIVV